MKKLLLCIIPLWLIFAGPVHAVNVNIDGLPSAASVAGANLFECEQGAVNKQCTGTQMAAFIYGLMSGDATTSGTGAITFATVNGNVGSFGSATSCTTITVNAKGLITAASQATCTPAVGSISGLATGIATWLATPTSANLLAALTTKTGTGNAVFGSAPTIDSLNATTAMTLAFLTGAGTQCVQVSNTGVVSGTGSACGGSGSTGANPTATASDTAVNGAATTFMRSDGSPAVQKASNAQFGVMEGDGSTISCTAGVCSFNAPINAQVGTTYPVVSTDKGKIITFTNAAPVAVSIPVASTSGFGSTFYTTLLNLGAGLVTITPTTSVFNPPLSLTSFTLKQGQSLNIFSDGTNYFLDPGRPNNVACADLTNAGALCSTTPGTGVATAAANALSAAGGLTSTILPNGTAVLGTSAIASGACASVVTTTATNVLTTDVVYYGYNSDPTAVTGYGASATGAVLSIYPYPTAGSLNVKVCNSTASSITPGAMTLNLNVHR